uniref:Ion transport domain-containing protein n=1 Tax=Cryptomonas curvata TaxID=233186 RepID=A0A7S0M0P5_9CRYP|mmetsp:Transcript_16519/g.34988  ORF Transcript_16519/g.34988 Transcript_16519/m.34988 type:complete len:150 (+) Transcript_16519:83-532(+)
MQAMVLCNALFLLYTACIAPVQICLWNYDNPCNSIPTLYFDAFVDVFFLVDVVVQLCVGIYDDKLEYIDDWRMVATRTMLSGRGFWFDCATSFPCSLVDLSHYLVRTQRQALWIGLPLHYVLSLDPSPVVRESGAWLTLFRSTGIAFCA